MPTPLAPIESLCVGDWRTGAVSASGMHMIVAPVNGELEASNNQGNTFTTATGTGGAQSWAGVAQSSDGMKICALTTDGKAFTSLNGGLSFTERPPAASGVTGWTAVATAMDDFSVLVATATNGKIYWTTDGVRSGAKQNNQLRRCNKTGCF